MQQPARINSGLWFADFSVAGLVIFCADGSSAAAQTHVCCEPPLPPSKRPRTDPRAGRRLPPDAPHVRRKRAVACSAGDTLTVDNARTADITIIDCMHDVHALFAALIQAPLVRHDALGAVGAVHARVPSWSVGHQAWQEFSFLGGWDTLALTAKLELLEKKACYELFLFLRYADEPFFLEHVKPLLAMRTPSERDAMTLILVSDTDALAARMRDMHAVSRMTALEVLLAAAELRDAAVLRAAALRWRTPPADRELQQWYAMNSHRNLFPAALSAHAHLHVRDFCRHGHCEVSGTLQPSYVQG